MEYLRSKSIRFLNPSINNNLKHQVIIPILPKLKLLKLRKVYQLRNLLSKDNLWEHQQSLHNPFSLLEKNRLKLKQLLVLFLKPDNQSNINLLLKQILTLFFKVYEYLKIKECRVLNLWWRGWKKDDLIFLTIYTGMMNFISEFWIIIFKCSPITSKHSWTLVGKKYTLHLILNLSWEEILRKWKLRK